MAKSPKKQKPGPFGLNLLDRRKRFDMTQDVLSERASVSKSYISSLESGARANPSEGIARRLADVFQCDVSDLWGRDQSSFEARAMDLLRAMPEDRREAAIAALYGLASTPADTRRRG
jgi:transcriptional regulator with XRE-family HTH domain